jgi:hypothetical protein
MYISGKSADFTCISSREDIRFLIISIRYNTSAGPLEEQLWLGWWLGMHAVVLKKLKM